MLSQQLDFVITVAPTSACTASSEAAARNRDHLWRQRRFASTQVDETRALAHGGIGDQPLITFVITYAAPDRRGGVECPSAKCWQPMAIGSIPRDASRRRPKTCNRRHRLPSIGNLCWPPMALVANHVEQGRPRANGRLPDQGG